ncbi:MAG: methionine--tRNA ligase [Planctomycetes bacterium]|nr:methionine--tRNA ligase [Planctomycetota bacterium]
MNRYLVTSALPYANGPIHFGHVTGAYLPADVYVRLLRMRGEEVLFVCGADEYGTAITINAEKEGLDYSAYVARWRDTIKDTFDRFGIQFDVWSGTSSCAEHAARSQDFFRTLDRNGYLLKQRSEQLYCPKDEMFLADRYVVGTCYLCGHEAARGNECPNCGQELEPLKMKVVACKICGTRPEKRATQHWYLDLPKLRDDGVGAWFADHDWKPNVTGFIGNQLKAIEPRPITRDMRWGVPVPEDLAGGEVGKVLYVWFDAPIGYVSFTEQWARERGTPDAWKRWWQSSDTRLVHFIGKDNIPFHCLVFPAMLFGQKSEWILPWHVPANEFYNLQGGKFSTSQNWTIPLAEFAEKYDTECARFYLLASAPETADSEWRWEEFQSCVNAGLADTIGNLVTRVLRFIDKNYGSKIPELHARHAEELDRIILSECGAIPDPGADIAEFRFRRSAESLLACGRVANVFVDRMAPWALRKTDNELAESVLNTCCQWLAWQARWMAPFMPIKAQKLWAMLGQAGDVSAQPWPGVPVAGTWRTLAGGTQLGTVEGLFQKIEDSAVQSEIAALSARAVTPA